MLRPGNVVGGRSRGMRKDRGQGLPPSPPGCWNKLTGKVTGPQEEGEGRASPTASSAPYMRASPSLLPSLSPQNGSPCLTGKARLEGAWNREATGREVAFHYNRATTTIIGWAGLSRLNMEASLPGQLAMPPSALPIFFSLSPLHKISLHFHLYCLAGSWEAWQACFHWLLGSWRRQLQAMFSPHTPPFSGIIAPFLLLPSPSPFLPMPVCAFSSSPFSPSL